MQWSNRHLKHKIEESGKNWTRWTIVRRFLWTIQLPKKYRNYNNPLQGSSRINTPMTICTIAWKQSKKQSGKWEKIFIWSMISRRVFLRGCKPNCLQLEAKSRAWKLYRKDWAKVKRRMMRWEAIFSNFLKKWKWLK